MLHVALVPPYGEVDNAVKPMPKSDGEARRYATRCHIEDIREHGRKKNKTKKTFQKNTLWPLFSIIVGPCTHILS